MKATVIVALLFACSSLAVAQPAEPAADWAAWEPLVGNWVADASPDGAIGGFSFTPELQKRVLVRKNFADYPKTRAHHEDLLVVYKDGAATRADYWDNEGHVIRYTVTLSDGGKKYSFVSDAQTGKPRFRLTYTMTGTAAVAIGFDIAPPGNPEAWKPYIKASAHKKP